MMEEKIETKYVITKKQARIFLLKKHGLIDDYIFDGKSGALDFIKQVGCLQFDPLDSCGRNADLVLQSRVKDYSKQILFDLLYKERLLIDYFDKNLAIFPIDDWKFFSRTRNAHKKQGKSKEDILLVENKVKKIIKENVYACSKDLQINESVDWYWSKTSLARAALETLYFRGDLVIHHKQGTIKYYSLTEDLLPLEIINQTDPNETEYEFMKWMMLRRIGAVGMLWNKPSDAWLGISSWSGVEKMTSLKRSTIFNDLSSTGEIIPIQVEDLNVVFYCLKKDISLLEEIILNKDYNPRIELLAPLDNLLWDRKLIEVLFDFSYTWEVYTPISKRKFGYYVLPIIYGSDIIGRTEIIADKKSKKLLVKNIWLEQNKILDKELWIKCLKRFAKFNDCLEIKSEIKDDDTQYN